MTSTITDRLTGSAVTANSRTSGLGSSKAIKAPCRVKTTANITLSGLQTIDGVSVVADDWVLVANQTTQTGNGIYVASSGVWTRRSDFDDNADTETGTLVYVTGGSVGSGFYVVTTATDPIEIGTDNITFAAVTLAGVGDVVGPGSAVADRIAVFNGTTGKLLKDGGSTIALLATLLSPTFTGTPAAPTAAPGTNTTQLATTAFVATSFAPLASPALTGVPTVPTAAPGTNTTQAASTAFVTASVGGGGSTWDAGAIYGLTLSRASSTTFGIAAGACRNEDAGTAVNMTYASAFTKSLSAWASGTGNGGLDTGAVANSTWYHVHAIGVGSSSLDFLYSLSATAPTMPATYTSRRRIGSILTNGSAQIVAFIQNGDVFTWDVPVADVNAANPGTSAVTRTLTVPTGVVVFPIVNWFIANNTSASTNLLITPLSITDTTPSATLFTAKANVASAGAAGNTSVIPTNTSGQVRSRLSTSGAADTLTGSTQGWTDTRGRL